MIVSIVLNDMDRTQYATFGFRSWLLQDISEPYEVIMNLFNDQVDVFEKLKLGANKNATVKVFVYDRPSYFNISAANNLGLKVATGKYVIFANSDVIYPSKFLNSYLREINKLNIAYALASRVNLTNKATNSLHAAHNYSLEHGFDSLLNCQFKGHAISIGGGGVWCVLRNVAIAIGGFDAQIICHEDSEFNDRVMHYLRRTNQQACLLSFSDMYGYHMFHAPSELYDASIYSRNILEPRRLRLLADPLSTEDIMLHQTLELKDPFLKLIKKIL